MARRRKLSGLTESSVMASRDKALNDCDVDFKGAKNLACHDGVHMMMRRLRIASPTLAGKKRRR